MKRGLQLMAALCIVCAVAQAQKASATSANANLLQTEAGNPDLQDAKPGVVPSKTRMLKGAGAGGLDEAAQAAATHLATEASANQGGRSQNGVKEGAKNDLLDVTKAGGPAKHASTAGDAVVEFQPAHSNVGEPPLTIKDHPRASRVHGDLYGSSGAVGNATGGAAGATSKSGKTSIYVESDQARSSASQPH